MAVQFSFQKNHDYSFYKIVVSFYKIMKAMFTKNNKTKPFKYRFLTLICIEESREFFYFCSIDCSNNRNLSDVYSIA